MSATTKHTPGPWQWYGNANSNHIYLATVHGGRRYVMDFTRWGMRGAQPRFQPRERGGMVDAKDLLQFEVGDYDVVGVDQARKNTSVYRLDVEGIDCADARLIAAAPDLLAAAKAVRDAIYRDDHAAAEELLQAAIAKAEGRSNA